MNVIPQCTSDEQDKQDRTSRTDRMSVFDVGCQLFMYMYIELHRVTGCSVQTTILGFQNKGVEQHNIYCAIIKLTRLRSLLCDK